VPPTTTQRLFKKDFTMFARSLALSFVALAGLAPVALAQTQVSRVGGALTLTTNNTDQNVKVELKDGITRLFGFQGIADGQSYTGITAISVNTGVGRDEIQFDIEHASSLTVRANFGAGEALNKTQWKVLAGQQNVNADFAISSVAGPALQLAEVNIDVESLGTTSVAINTGNAQLVSAKVGGDALSQALQLSFTSRAAITNLETTTAAGVVNATLRGTHATPGSEVKYSFSQLRRGVMNVNASGTLSSGADKLEGKVSTPGSLVTLTGNTNAGAGDDLVQWELEGSSTTIGTTVGASIAGGAGNDFLSIAVKGRYQLSQTQGASLFGNEGDDVLVLTTDTAIVGTGLPNDVNPVIDGGAGFDLYNAFGIIRNCEGRL
jgi:hypothetical protein